MATISSFGRSKREVIAQGDVREREAWGEERGAM